MLKQVISLAVLCTCSAYASEQALIYTMLPSEIRTQILSYVVADRLPVITVGVGSRLAKTAPLQVADIACVNTTFASDIQALRNDTRLNQELVARIFASLRAFNGEPDYVPYEPAERVFDHFIPGHMLVAYRFERKFHADDATLTQFAQSLLGDRKALATVAQEYVVATERLLAPKYEQYKKDIALYRVLIPDRSVIEIEAKEKEASYAERPYSQKVSEFTNYSMRLMETLAFMGLTDHSGNYNGYKAHALKKYNTYVHDTDFQRFYDTRLLLFLTLPFYAQQHDAHKQLAENAARDSRFFTTLTRLIAQAHAQKQ